MSWHTKVYATPGAWAEHAACIGHARTFAAPENRYRHTPDETRRLAEARAICHTCPVFVECRAWALTDPDPVEAMVAAGLTPWQRVAIRNLAKPPRRRTA